jgi:hypothetical protein
MPYTTLQRVQQRAGVALTSDQVEEAARLIPAADAFIDQRTGVVWDAPAAVSDEAQRVYSNRIRLRRPPVATISRVALRSTTPNEMARELDPTEYELADPWRGVLLLPRGASWWPGPGGWCPATWTGPYVLVSYTRPAGPDPEAVDPRVSLAATDLVVYWLSPLLWGGSSGSAGVGASGGGTGVSTAGGQGLPAGEIKRYSVGGDLDVTFADGGRWGVDHALGVPADLVGLLDSLRVGRASFA